MLGKKIILSAIAALFIVGAAAPSMAQSAVEDAIGGAILGAGVAAISKGNVGTGALVGAGAGVLLGASRRPAPYYAPRRAYRPPPHVAPRPYRPVVVLPRVSQLVADIQYSLTNLGYDPGPVDGLMGPGTRAAVRAYQRDAGLLITGRISKQLLKHIRSQGG
ncbi:MAG: peptidoglycan-binding protein [Hyphomicrobiales bacterium]